MSELSALKSHKNELCKQASNNIFAQNDAKYARNRREISPTNALYLYAGNAPKLTSKVPLHRRKWRKTLRKIELLLSLVGPQC